MGSLHVPRLAWPRWARLRRGRRGLAVLAVAALAAMTLVNGTQHAAYAATAAPYGGTPAAVPGTVQAANYDTGGQGVAYNVTSVNGSADSYRSDGVDLEDTADTQDTSAAGGAYDMGWTTAGQWFNYTVDVPTAGTYSVGLRLSSPYGITDGLHIANAAGTNLTGPIAVPDTGGYQDWTTVTASVTLPAGTTLRSGPDTGQSALGTVPPGNSILAAEPLVWTDHSGGVWLAFFLSCGGENLYWVSVSELTHHNAAAGKQVEAQIETLRTAPPYTSSGLASLLPIQVTAQKHLAFVDPKVTFAVGRGELIGVPT